MPATEPFNLLIVESPNKSKTIAKYLSGETASWRVMATLGHILNLPKDEHGIEFRDDVFWGKWVFEKDKNKIVREIAEVAQLAQEVFVATDPDREGEKIASDVVAKAKLARYHRVTFSEITKAEIVSAINDRRKTVDTCITEAQRARRFIDREIGYPISRMIRADFKRMQRSELPAGVGRVLSAALHILAVNEARIEAFVVETYKQIIVDYAVEGIPFRVTNRTRFKEENLAQLLEVMHLIRTAEHVVEKFAPANQDSAPYTPLTTSRLQRGAFYLFGIEPQKTMTLAQQLFELGYITYHRTDSFRVSDIATDAMIKILLEHYGAEHTLQKKRMYKNTKKISDAHEAIRPTYFEDEYLPGNIYSLWTKKGDTTVLGKDHLKLYEFICYRSLSVQMKNSVYDRTKLWIDVAGVKFIAVANHQLYPGWEQIAGQYIKASEQNSDDSWKERDIQLPRLIVGDTLKPVNIEAIEKKTTHPDRYGIGRFITVLDDAGIGRPSTLDGIVPSMQKKGYVVVRNGMLYVTELGRDVDAWVVEKCPWMADREHAKMIEDQLDQIEAGELQNADSLIRHYHDLVQAVASDLGIDFQIGKPSQNQIAYAQSLAKQNQLEIPENILENEKATAAFIERHKPQRIELGPCPECKDGTVLWHAKMVSCFENKKGCGFLIWHKDAEKFLDRFGIDQGEESIQEIIRCSLGKKPKYFPGIKGKSGTVFNASIVVGKHDQFGWQLTFDFKNKRL